MKIVITADLHYQLPYIKKIQDSVQLMKEEKPDVLLLAGDIAENHYDFERCLELFKDFIIPRGLVIGNHDLWKTVGTPTSSLWESILPKFTRRNKFTWLEEDSIIIGSVAIVGTLGWYDYSNAKGFKLMDSNFYSFMKKQHNHDGTYIDWSKKDVDFARELQDGLVVRLDELASDDTISDIIVVTHVPVFKKQMVPSPGDNAIGDAYFGNFTLGNVISGYQKVSHVVSGHTHRGVADKVGGINISVVGSEYGCPKYITIEV